jgi:lipopolysaccharide export system permease protein
LFSIWRSRLANKYIFFELLPTFLMGAFLFIFIILMFQSFRLTEYVIVHGASLSKLLEILLYLAISFLPVVLPMSLLFAVLLTYGRLSADSEIVALKSLGLNLFSLLLPAIVLGIVISITSMQTSFYLAPWGNRKMETILHELGETKPEANIKPGVFSEGFFDMVVYANEVDTNNNLLNKIFIFDERNSTSPMTIIAKTGKIIQETNSQGHTALLRLYKGNIHRTLNEVYTKVDFKTFDINLSKPNKQTEKNKTPLSYNLVDLRNALSNKESLEPKLHKKLEIEYYRRYALAFICLIFSILGVALGTNTNKRSGKSSGLVLSIAIVVGYWVIYATMETLAKNNTLPVALAMWSGNLLFLIFAFYKLHQSSKI